VPEGADAPTIKRAYHRMVRAVHPDLQPHLSVQQRVELQAQFRALTSAYQQLQ
jgi:DnaJ-class molecular chaperone